MQRRDFLAGTPAVLATACSAEDIAPLPIEVTKKKKPEAPKAERPAKSADERRPHEGHEGHAGHQGHAGPANNAVLGAAAACASAGQVCLQHCLALLAEGDKAMAPCAQATTDMIAVSQATASLAASGSPQLGAQAAVALAAATRCEGECRKHADTHATCRDCADSCSRAIAAYRTLAG